MSDLPPTRWESEPSSYGEAFARRVEAGEDVYGEARLADVLVPRGARILDAGSGMGRIGAELHRRGHRAVGVDLDVVLVAQSRATYPDFPVLVQRLDTLTADDLTAAGFPSAYDLVACLGNVMILLAPGSEVTVLSRLADLLAPGGRLLVGFATNASKPASRLYSREEFLADATDAGLVLQSSFSAYDLTPYDPDAHFLIAVLSRES